jgi:hypothetical protein
MPQRPLKEKVMATVAKRKKKLVLSREVKAFAKERGLEPYLPAILEILHRVFADAKKITAQIDDDPEEAGLRDILFEAVVPWTKEQWRAGMKAWYRETAAACPAPLRHLFCLITYRRP